MSASFRQEYSSNKENLDFVFVDLFENVCARTFLCDSVLVVFCFGKFYALFVVVVVFVFVCVCVCSVFCCGGSTLGLRWVLRGFGFSLGCSPLY